MVGSWGSALLPSAIYGLFYDYTAGGLLMIGIAPAPII